MHRWVKKELPTIIDIIFLSSCLEGLITRARGTSLSTFRYGSGGAVHHADLNVLVAEHCDEGSGVPSLVFFVMRC